MSAEAQPSASPTAVLLRLARPGGGVELLVLTAGAILLALALFGAFVAALGADPWAVYRMIVFGAFGTRFSIENTLAQAGPIMLTALCTLIPARVGLLVIGGEGAVVLGGLGAAVAGVALTGLGPWPGLLVCLIAGTITGAAWIACVGALRLKREVNETISSLLFNYLAIAIFLHLTNGPFRDYTQVLKPQTAPVPTDWMIGDLPELSVHWGLVIGAGICLMLGLFLRSTTTGFAWEVIGGNRRAAQAVGLPVGRMMLLACALGGAAAGLAGAIEVMAVHGAASESLIVRYGYTGILVAFLARQNPVLVIPVALLLGGISASGGLLQRRFDLPDAATDVLQGLIFLCVLASNTLAGRLFPGPK